MKKTSSKLLSTQAQDSIVITNFFNDKDYIRKLKERITRKIITSEEKLDSNTRQLRTDFINSDLETWLSTLGNLLNKTTVEDRENILKFKTNPAIQDLLNHINTLEQFQIHTIAHFADKRIAFWSGKKARKHVEQSDKFVSDTNVASFRVLFAICNVATSIERFKENLQINTSVRNMSSLFSAFFAMNVKGEAHFFSSVLCGNETQSGIEVGNYFWRAELQTIQLLKSIGIVKEIIVHTYNSEKQAFFENRFTEDSKNILVRIRPHHDKRDQKRGSLTLSNLFTMASRLLLGGARINEKGNNKISHRIMLKYVLSVLKNTSSSSTQENNLSVQSIKHTSQNRMFAAQNMKSEKTLQRPRFSCSIQ